MSGMRELAEEPKAIDANTSEVDVRLEQDRRHYQLDLGTEDSKLHRSDVNYAVKASQMFRPYLTVRRCYSAVFACLTLTFTADNGP
jgi:hypothetical protein